MKSFSYLPLVALAVVLAGCGEKDPAAADTASSPTSSAESTPSNQVILTTALPPKVIEGTPMPIKVPNLELAPEQAPTLSVPVGTRLLSAGKPVTGSDDFPIIGELSYLTDGDKLGGEGYYVEIIDGLQWLQIDLEQSYDLSAIWLWHFHSQARAYHDVIVQVSNDETFQSGVTTLFNNDNDNSAGLGRGNNKPYVETHFGKLIDAKGTNARYVRFYSNGNTSNDMNHYIEAEVFGQ